MRVFRVRKLLELQAKLVNILLIQCSLEHYWSYYIVFLLCIKIFLMIHFWMSFVLNCVHYLYWNFPVPYHCLLHYSTFGNINKNRDFKCKKYVSLSLLIFALVSTGKAAVPLAFTVTLQSILSWTGDPLHSITNEGLCIDGQAGSLCLFCCHNTVWPLFLKHQSKCISSYFLQSGFRNHNAPWKSALISVQKRNGSQVASSISLASTVKDKTISRKRVWKSV